MKVKIICFIFSSLLISCNTVEDNSIPVINLIKATYKKVAMSDVFDKVEYVRLETHADCLLSDEPTLYVTNHYIIATEFKLNAAYLFERKTGKFIKQISRQGSGPNEYISLVLSYAFDEKNQIMYFDRKRDWIGFHIESGEVSIVEKPYSTHNGILHSTPNNIRYYIPPVREFFKLDTMFYCGFANNITGNDTIRLVIFDSKGTLYKTIPNFQFYENCKPNMFDLSGGEYYQFKGNWFFKEPVYNDTIYKVTRDSIIPHIIFFLGKKQPEYHLRESDFKNRDVYNLYLIGECERFILFNFFEREKSHSGYFDKKNHETFICTNNTNVNGYINDIDNMLDFYPRFMNNAGEFYGVLKACDISAFFSKHKNFNKNLTHLSGIKDDDNPVVVIAKLKQYSAPHLLDQ